MYKAHTDSERNAFGEGYNAAWDGSTQQQCAYSENSDEFGAWQAGYDEAAREIAQERECAEVDEEVYADTYY